MKDYPCSTVCRRWLAVGLAWLGGASCALWAQPFELASGRVTSGGGHSAGGDFAVLGSLAQPDAGVTSGEAYAALGGFWNLMTLPSLLEAGTDEVPVSEGRSVKVPLSGIVGNDRSVLGYPVALAEVDTVTERGGSIAVAGGWLIYRPPAGPASDDRFHYVLTDGGAGPRHSVVGTVELRVGAASTTETPPNAVRILATGGDVQLTFVGVPGRSYRIQYAVQLTPVPVWREFAPEAVVVAAANGVFQFTDVAPPEDFRWYRAVAASVR